MEINRNAWKSITTHGNQSKRMEYINSYINSYMVSGLNGDAVARHGLKLWENGATVCKILMDTFLDQHLTIFDCWNQKSNKNV